MSPKPEDGGARGPTGQTPYRPGTVAGVTGGVPGAGAIALAEARRARACPHRSPCNCQHVECGFLGRVVPARDCLACPIKDQHPPPVARG